MIGSESKALSVAAGSELVRLVNVTKSFPGVKALDRVNLTIRGGQVLALVGENGAGKSTLMKVLSGVYPSGSFEGEILIDGKRSQFKSPLDAERAGIAIIHQELSSFKHLTVAENLFVGHWPARAGVLDWNHLRTLAQKWLDRVGATCSPDDKMGDLSVGAQQMVEISKALSRNSRVLILDEPTSALTPREVDCLLALLRELRAEGKGLVYISHKMGEIYSISDHIAVIRDGKSVFDAPVGELAQDALVSHMVGRPLNEAFPPLPSRSEGDVVLCVKNLFGWNERGRKLFGPVSFELKRGEILGFAGLLGAGRSELMQAIFGDNRIQTEGEIWLGQKRLEVDSPRAGLKQHIAFVSEDRKNASILPKRSLEENVSVSRLASARLWNLLERESEFNAAAASLKQLNTRCTGPSQEIQNLSGGNQQKAVIARALQISPEVVILDEPTRGIDVGAKFEIYEILFQLAKEGKALLVVSSDLPEIIGLCDRVLVLAQGEMMGCLTRKEFSQPAIMKLAVGRAEFAPVALC